MEMEDAGTKLSLSKGGDQLDKSRSRSLPSLRCSSAASVAASFQ